MPCSRYSRGEWRLKHCSQCELLYLENAPAVEALAEEYSWQTTSTAEQHRRLDSRRWGRLHSAWKEARCRWIPHWKAEALVQQYVGAGNLLDVGCATGSLFLRLPPGIVPYGIEIDAVAFEQAQSRAEQLGGRVLQADALAGLRTLQAEGIEIAGIVMISFLEHEINALAVLRAAARVLRPGGAIIIKVPNFACWNRRLRGKDWPGFRFPDHVNYFTPRTLAQLVRKAGLKITRFAWRDRLRTSDNMWLVAGKVS